MAKPKRRRLLHFLSRSNERRYVPPPAEDCFEHEFNVHLVEECDDDQITVRQRILLGKVVDFSINQTTAGPTGKVDVARIDTSHGTVHRHQFYRRRIDKGKTVLLYEIPPESGEDLVSKVFPEALAIMQNDWETNLERWRCG